MNEMLSLTVNGKNYELPSLPGESLAELLRQRLHLTGTKIGCNEAECGACTVIIDGEPVLSCVYPALKASGRHVDTIEGLAHSAGECRREGDCREIGAPGGQGFHLHALQAEFVEHGAAQCGFCTSGFIM